MTTARRPMRTARHDEVLENIIDTSARLFATRGYAATGVAEIGEAVGLARGALYYYIGSKNGLLSAIHDRVLDPLLHHAERIRALELTPAARIVLLSRLLLEQIVERRDHVWVFLHEHRQMEGRERTVFRAKRARFEQVVTDVVAEGIALGQFRDLDTRLATLSWLNLHNYTYIWVASEPRVSAAQISREYCRIFLGGIGAEPGVLDDLEQQVRSGVEQLSAGAES